MRPPRKKTLRRRRTGGAAGPVRHWSQARVRPVDRTRRWDPLTDPLTGLRSALVVVFVVVGLDGVAVLVVVIVAEQVGDVDAVELLEPLGGIRGELVVRIRGPGEPVTRHLDVTGGELGVRIGVEEASRRRAVRVDPLHEVAETGGRGIELPEVTTDPGHDDRELHPVVDGEVAGLVRLRELERLVVTAERALAVDHERSEVAR